MELSLPNWAEQLEAWSTFAGAIFAFGAIIVAWVSIRKQIKEQQDNINTLTGVVETLTVQSEALGKQTEALSESMRIDSKILAVLTSLVTKNAEIADLTAKRNRLENKPDMKVRFTSTSGNKHYNFMVKNEGLVDAKNVKVHLTKEKDTDYTFSLSISGRERLSQNMGIGGGLQHLTYGQRQLPNELGNIMVEYESTLGEKYELEYTIKYDGTRLVFEKIRDDYMGDL